LLASIHAIPAATAIVGPDGVSYIIYYLKDAEGAGPHALPAAKAFLGIDHHPIWQARHLRESQLSKR